MQKEGMGRDKAPPAGKAAVAKAAAEKKAIDDLKAKGVEAMECRHILVDKHSEALKILEILSSGDARGIQLEK